MKSTSCSTGSQDLDRLREQLTRRQRFVDERPEGTIALVDPAFELYLDLGKHVDLEAERRRVEKEMLGLRKKLDQVDNKLSNAKFLKGARPEVVAAQKVKREELREMLEKLEELRSEYESSA